MTQVVEQTAIQLLTELGQFGGLANGGVTRLVYDQAWVDAMTYTLKTAEAQGMQVHIDAMGNGFMTYPGVDQTVIAAGSHIDTVQQGGIYDGAYGVVAAKLAMTQLVAEFGQPKHTMTAVAFSEEEGSRFPVSFSGSRHYAQVGDVAPDLKDAQGISFDTARRQALAQLTANFTRVEQPLPKEWLELHIEQGPVLEEAGYPLGVVSAICEQKRFTITLTGQANHAGTTPQHLRRDALKAAARLIVQLDDLAERMGEPFVFTVGEISVTPGSSNVIPGQAVFSVDIRHPQKTVVDEFEAKMRQMVADSAPVSGTVDCWMDSRPAVMDPRLVRQFDSLLTQHGYQYLTLPSGAGHDTQIMNLKVPTAMLFVPSRGGISHAPAEYTDPAALEAGVAMLKAQLYHECY